MTIREAIAQGSADLKFAEIENPGLDAALLLSHILKVNRTILYAKGPEKINEKDSSLFCSFIERRCNGECAAYITGIKEFRGLDFFVNPSVLVPRPDTETLVEATLKILSEERHAKSQGKENPCAKVLDLCTGSGAIAVSLKNEMPEPEIHAADISSEALETAKLNAEKLLGKNKIYFYHGDLFNALSSSKSSLRNYYSLIISNPPYIPSEEIKTLPDEVQNEPLIALDGGESGLEIIKQIINEAPDYLRQGGVLLLEADPMQMENIKFLLEKRGFQDLKLYKDLSGKNRVIGGKVKTTEAFS